jgi:glycosyltransferase involved in cell wall biosynthesis
VWTEVLARLGRFAELQVGNPTPDVWLIGGHNGDPAVQGPVVACVYEVGWGDPELDRDYAPEFVARIAKGTEDAVRRSDHIVTCSFSSKDQIVNTYGVAPERVHVVPLGIDPCVFRPVGPLATHSQLRTRAGLTGPYVLFAASLHPRKNLLSVRRAMTGLARRGFPHTLAIVASPAPDRPDSSHLEQQAFAELPGFPGRVVRIIDPSDHELNALMAGAVAVCQPSKAEGFGLTVLEAMAAGAPVVVSNRGSLPELVGRGGLIVEPTPEGVERALEDIITHPSAARRMSARALRRARRLTWDRTAEGWWRVAATAARAGEGRNRTPPH